MGPVRLSDPIKPKKSGEEIRNTTFSTNSSACPEKKNPVCNEMQGTSYTSTTNWDGWREKSCCCTTCWQASSYVHNICECQWCCFCCFPIGKMADGLGNFPPITIFWWSRVLSLQASMTWSAKPLKGRNHVPCELDQYCRSGTVMRRLFCCYWSKDYRLSRHVRLLTAFFHLSCFMLVTNSACWAHVRVILPVQSPGKGRWLSPF